MKSLISQSSPARATRFAAALAALSLAIGMPVIAQGGGDKQSLVEDGEKTVTEMKEKQAAVQGASEEAPDPTPEQLAEIQRQIERLATVVTKAEEQLGALRDAQADAEAQDAADKLGETADRFSGYYTETYNYFDQQFNSTFNLPTPTTGGATGDGTTGGPPGDTPEKGTEAPKADDLFTDEGPDLPTSEYVPTAERMLTEMRTELSRALDQLARARSEKDAVKLNYINEQVTTMKGIMRISDDAFIALQEAVSSGAMEKARYEFGKIRVSHRKMKELGVAIQNAKGAEASYTGGTDVRLEIDEAVVGGDPYYGNPDFFYTPETGVVDRTDDGVGGEDPVDARPPPASATGA